ncbi:uncharacterized protein LOC135483120 [Lineus longissimus]|uniref:uncharacterized protein LOC135483120 n=1 Tax=Lineus longissimus TaxID=88925 RepID=UPI002B4EFF8E
MPPSEGSPESVGPLLRAHRAHPFSLERIRRKVLLRLHVLDKYVMQMTDKWLKNRVAAEVHSLLKDELAEFITTLLNRVGAKGFGTIAECRNALEHNKSSRRLRDQKEFALLLRMCESVDVFDVFTEKCQKTLFVEYNERLNKYCQSFFSDAGNHDLSSVQCYERLLTDKQKEIEDILKSMEKVVGQYAAYKKTFGDFLKHYEDILSLMEEFSRLVIEIGEPMKEWVFLDRDYPRKLMIEIGELTNARENIGDEAKKIQNDLEFTERKINRRVWQRRNFEEFIQEQRFRFRSTKHRGVATANNQVKTEQIYQARKKQLAELTARLETRRHSPRAYDKLAAKHRTLEADVRVLEEKVVSIKKQRQDLYEEMEKLTKDLHQNQLKFEKMLQVEEKLMLRRNKEKRVIKETRDKVRGLDEKIAALKRIRDIKLHPDTVRKIRLHGYHAGGMDHIEEPIDTAFRLVARNIGKNWSDLYMKLPFDPDRDYCTRNEDLRVIDLNNQRLDCDIKESVIKSLQKWHRLSHTATLGQLVYTLKRIKRPDIVNSLQQKVMVASA